MSTNKKSPIKVVNNSIKPDAYALYAGNGGLAKFNAAMNSATQAYSGRTRGGVIDTFQTFQTLCSE